MLNYPNALTDVEWKKAEKQLKISDTGVGKTLRDLEKAHKGLDQAVQAMKAGKADVAKVTPVKTSTVAAAKKAHEALNKTYTEWVTKKKPKPATDFLFKMQRLADDYHDEIKALDLADHRGIEWAAKVYNGRVK